MSDFVQRHFPGLCESSLFRVMVWQWMAIGLALLTAVGLGAALSRLFHVVSRSVAKRPDSNRLVSLSRAIQNPLAGLIALGALSLALHFIALGGHVGAVFDKGIAQLFIGEGAWLLVGGGRWLTADLETRLLGADEFSSRGARTQLRLAHYVWTGLVVLMALALILSGFRVVLTIGVSLLASGGILGIVVGIAAQKSIGGLVVGIQLAVTQQVRIGDTVIVDSERGTVEEIHLTFVVLRLWDLRRMIVPATHFLEQSFQNWTRVRTHLIGTVDLWVDYAAPLAPLREELASACKASKLWDGKTCLLQVTDASDKAIKIRMLVSAEGSTHLFDLRCDVREKVVALLQSLKGGLYLPHDRSSSFPETVVGPSLSIASPASQREPHAPVAG